MPQGPRTSAVLASEMSTLASTRSAICTHVPFATKTHEGRTMSYLKITSGAGTKSAVIIIAGIHAREWAPPDASLSFAQMLCTAYAGGTSISYPAFTDPDTSIAYTAFTISSADVRAAVERLDIYILPVVNPDGRDFSLSSAASDMWRKNRSPNPASGGCIGTDLNRSIPMAWDFEMYYKAAVASTPSMTRLKDPCDPNVYHGRGPASEIETTNVKNLIDAKNPGFFIDVHSYGRKLMFSWATETNESANATQNFGNANWNRTGPMGGRDGTSGALYAEFFPNAAPTASSTITSPSAMRCETRS